MCGINGFNFESRDLIIKMNEVTKHRGPDQTDVFVSDNISLGFNRLAIIDLSEKANQPMWDDRHEVAIIFNGEIYNFQDLREDLKKKYVFQSNSDTEVILNLYKEYGIDCVNKLNGMFAFAIWDIRTQDLWIVRDRMGIKPLYYFYDGKQFIFSSEIKAILEHDIKRQVDVEAFNLYMHVLYVPEPHTMFAGIKKLPLASYLRLNKGNKLSLTKYWKIDDFSNTDLSKHEIEEKILSLFQDSVRRQLVSDRPVGVFLSGGIDSTAVLGVASECSGEKVSTFSVGFDVKSSQAEKFNADFFLARQTAKYYNTVHHELTIGARDVIDNIEKVVWHLGEPDFNPTAVAQFLLSKMAKQDVAVVLGGDGGDELFGGYPRYYYSRLLSYYHKMPSALRRTLETALKAAGKEDIVSKLMLGSNSGVERILAFLSQKPSLISDILQKNIFNKDLTSQYFTKKYFHEASLPKDFEKHFMNIDRQSWLVDESLFRTDTMTMAWGLEQRVPILDYRLVELANKIPTSWKMHLSYKKPAEFQGKDIWRGAINKYIPDHVAKEKKRGWFTPMAKWMRDDLHDFVGDIVSPNNLNSDFFDANAVQKVWQDHVNGKVYNLNIIWAIVMWQLWYNEFIVY